jgi:transposase-like protein
VIAASTHGQGIGYAKMKIVDSLHSEPIRGFLRASLRAHQRIRTDGWQSYNVAEGMGHSHEVELIMGRNAQDVLKWVHILASNAKAFILGTYHGLGRKHLQSYLNKYCFRFNRRHTAAQVFDRLPLAYLSSRGLRCLELTE